MGKHRHRSISTGFQCYQCGKMCATIRKLRKHKCLMVQLSPPGFGDCYVVTNKKEKK